MYISMIENESEEYILHRLYESNKAFLQKTAMKYLKDKELSEDAVHNAFVDMLSKKDKLIGMSNKDFKKWSVTIVKYKAIDIIRRRGDKESFIEDTTDTFVSDSNPELEFIRKGDKELLSKELSKLNELDRIIIEFKYYHGLTYSEISQKLNLSQKNVEVRLQRAKNKLKRLLVKERICNEENKR